MTARQRTRPFLIADVKAIRMVASPLRQAIVDGVSARGPCTVADMAEQLQKPPDRLYYHVRLLQRAGLLVEVPGPADRAEARFDVPGRPMLLEYRSAPPAHRRAVEKVVRGILRAARSDMSIALADPLARTAGGQREVWAGRIEGTLRPAQVRRLNALISEIHRLLLGSGASAAGGRALQFTFALSPVRRGRAR